MWSWGSKAGIAVVPGGGYRQDISVVPATGAVGATGAVFPTGRPETLPVPPTHTSDITMTALKKGGLRLAGSHAARQSVNSIGWGRLY